MKVLFLYEGDIQGKEASSNNVRFHIVVPDFPGRPVVGDTVLGDVIATWSDKGDGKIPAAGCSLYHGSVENEDEIFRSSKFNARYRIEDTYWIRHDEEIVLWCKISAF